MEQWRERGYVPDSDEDDEFDSQELIGQRVEEEVILGDDHTDTEENNHEVQEDEGEEVVADAERVQDGNEHILNESSQRTRDDTVELETDPLQDDYETVLQSFLSPIKRRKKKPDDNTHFINTASQPEPPSSPDELQFEEFRPRPPQTPLAEPTEIHDDNLHFDSVNSSPLSSIPPLLESPPSRAASPISIQNEGEVEPQPQQEIIRPNDGDIDMVGLAGDGHSEWQNQSRRALRQRNAIQLHPYMLENAQYRSLLRNRGVQPVRMPVEESQPHNEPGESQSFEFQDENVLPSSSPVSFHLPASSPDMYDHSGLSQSLSQQNQATGQEESLKDRSNTHARLSSVKFNQVGSKRRKIAHGENDRRSGDSSKGNGNGVQVVIDNSPQKKSDLLELFDVFDVPPSPPSSGEASSALPRDPTTFRFPPGFTPNEFKTQLQTPLSEKGSQSDSPGIISIESSPVLDLDEEEEESPSVTHSSADDSTSESPEEDSLVIRQIQRQIKGVLPASFARLDREKHEEYKRQAAEKERRKALVRERRTGKGVAQPVSRKERAENQETPTRARNLDLFSDSESDDDATPMRSQQQKARELREQERLERHFGLIEDDDDIPEDNRIDYMAPPVSRRPKTKKRSAQKSRGQSSRRSGTESWTPFEWKPQRKRQTRITDNIGLRKAKPAKPRPPNLGILDAEDVRNQRLDTQPQFLRVAARRARSRKDKGRQSPSRKIFKLATKADTRDANSSLCNWRSGKYQQASGITSTRPRTTPRPHSRAGNPSPTSRATQANRATPITETDPEPIVIYDDDESLSKQDTRTGINKTKQRPKNNWVVNRPYGISSFQRHLPRPAQLDVEDIPTGISQPPSAFHRTLSALHKAYKSSKQPLTLTRFLSQANKPQQQQQPPPPPWTNAERSYVPTQQNVNDRPAPRKEVKNQRPAQRKRQPRHINIETFEYRQPPEFQNEKSDTVSIVHPEDDNRSSLPGLHRPENPYKLDFDTHPLYLGTYFHQSTFIGSGKFSHSLDVLSRDLDADNGHAIIRIEDKIYHWGPWNETVSSELGELFGYLGNQLSPQQTLDSTAILTIPNAMEVLGLYISVICYVTDHLSFRDPVDRINFVSRCTIFVSLLNDTYRSSFNCEKDVTTVMVRMEMLNLVFLNQLLQITNHESMDSSRVDTVVNLIKLSARRTMDFTLSRTGMENIQQLLEDNRQLEKREVGIRDDYPFVDAFVVTQNVLQQKAIKDKGLEMHFLDQSTATSPSSIPDLERAWEALFTLLPFQEIDQFGIFHAGLRLQLNHDRWPAVKQLMLNVLESYRSSPKPQWASLNNYMRTLLQRCFILIKNWGWRHCKPILETLFDFFTGNSLHDLEKEAAHGSPRFLDQLASDPVLDIDVTDSCFRMFLKIIAVGLKYLNSLLEPKKILNLVWRLLPNHGRTYPKEKPLRVEDLNALRNHHDLLCTLYCCAPQGCRPPLNTIRNLVHPPTSHKDACSINIHSWSRLVRFTLAKDGDASDLSKFAEWHSDFITDIVRQHSQARSEIEAEDPSASLFSRQYIEGAIIKNERHAEALISDALVCMRTAIDATRDADQAAMLMETMPLGKLFGLFRPKVRRLDAVVCQILDVLIAFTKANDRPAASFPLETQVDPSETNEDSQDDWLDLCQEQMEVSSAGSSYLNRAISPVLSQFISICFGVDQTPDNSILVKAIDCWLSVAHTRVKHGQRQWSSYFNRYDQDSWAALKPTNQTRRFMPYFISSLISIDAASYEECQSQILTCWSTSLVEKELFLKYQHDLTNALLNEDRENPLFRNLPFAVNGVTGRYEITLMEFCQRRTSLISCVLSNMRIHLSELEPGQIHASNGVGELYQEMIRSMMATMKQNSEEVGKTLAPGSYVDFVHRVVEFLQVHSEDICPIDRYFMDPASFPLPASDPNYVVAKLKRYEGRLSAGSKFAKQLVTFIQGVSERAAVDAQQGYLANQLYEAMSNSLESGSYKQPTLRCFLLQCVIPEYVSASLSNPTAWILARPFLQATTRVFSDLILKVDLTKRDEVGVTIDSITAYFESVHSTLQRPICDPHLLYEAPMLLTLTSIFESITASLAIVDYLDRLGEEVNGLLSYIEFFGQTALFCLSSLLDPPATTPPFLRDSPSSPIDRSLGKPPTFFAETRNFAARELEFWLADKWALHDGKYFVRRGQQYTKIDVTPGTLSVEVAKSAFIQTVQLLFGSIETLHIF
ncbi:uncharacterized protein GIQ15_05862 [Arthroderma uncinatum]|uniref:uncharacterized protein n=1 Tax=Arthroderma uncinatum TaxID=74035 RepID=UPI00144AF764|nr:uncharacterized protein GIQ15_05862 [Arthroderma uncinatum]KAF3480515.1 hypothetical protein GIQ15_05862 [Arthroderma uncinatum]